MATLYFNGAVDGDWQNLGNWWMAYDANTDTYSVPATGLPTSTDSVISSAAISSNSGSEPTVTNFILNNPGVGSWTYLGIDITVTGLCIFNSTESHGNINGDCIFNNAYNLATITGNCTFNGTGANYGAITGNCIFNDTASNFAGQFDPVFAVTGDCTFNDASQNSGNITANCTFNDTGGNYSPITGDCTFNDDSHNAGTITGDCVFNDNAINYWISIYESELGTWYVGTVNGNCTFSLSSAALHIDQALEKIKTSDSITGTIDFKYEKGINGSSILGIL